MSDQYIDWLINGESDWDESAELNGSKVDKIMFDFAAGGENSQKKEEEERDCFVPKSSEMAREDGEASRQGHHHHYHRRTHPEELSPAAASFATMTAPVNSHASNRMPQTIKTTGSQQTAEAAEGIKEPERAERPNGESQIAALLFAKGARNREAESDG